MRRQGKKMSQTHLHARAIKSNDSMAEEMSEKEFRIYIIEIIHEAKDERRDKRNTVNPKRMQGLISEIHPGMQFSIIFMIGQSGQ